MVHEEDAHNFLEAHGVGVVCTSSEHGDPWAAAVYYVTDEYGNVYFFTRSETVKLQNIRKDPRVAFVVFDEKNQTTLQLSGQAAELTDLQQLNLFYQKIQRSVASVRHPLPIEKLRDDGNYVIVKIEVGQSHFVDYTKMR